MKKQAIVYWTSTAILAAVMTYSVISFTIFDYTLYPEGAFVHLHLPAYFKIELTTAKVLGVLVLLVPGMPVKLKEFTYAGFAITLVSAAFAHFSVGDRILYIIDPLLFLGVLVVSYIYWNKYRAIH